MHTKIVLLPHLTAMTLLFHVDVRLWPVKRWNKKSYVKQRQIHTQEQFQKRGIVLFRGFNSLADTTSIPQTFLVCNIHMVKTELIRVLSVAFIYSIYSIYKRLHQLTYAHEIYAGELFHLFINFEMNPYEWFFFKFLFSLFLFSLFCNLLIQYIERIWTIFFFDI